MNVQLVKYSRIFLDLSWNWLNDEETRYLTNTPAFSKEDQLLWFYTLEGKEDYRIWGIRVDGEPVGACGLKNISGNDGEYWGYIGEKDYRGKGIGTKIMECIERKALKLKLKRIWLRVIPENIAARRLYEKSGYTVGKPQDSLIIMSKIL